MNWRVIIRPNAETDLREAWLWYESQRPGLGDELLVEVQAALHRLETDPENRPFYYRDFRRLLTRRFPYKLLYRIEPTALWSSAFCTQNANTGGSFEWNGALAKAVSRRRGRSLKPRRFQPDHDLPIQFSGLKYSGAAKARPAPLGFAGKESLRQEICQTTSRIISHQPSERQLSAGH